MLQASGGSGDKMFDWVFALTLVVFFSVVIVLWSVVDRRRQHYTRLQKWFRVYVRFGIATTMLGYGMVKVMPLQVGAPSLTRLLEPYGNFSPMGVLWASIGASFPYERVVGCAELLAAVLLSIAQTVVLGGIVSLLDSTQIFVLNMTYGVPVNTITLTQGAGTDRKTLGAFAFEQPAPDRLVLDGELNGMRW